MRCASCSTGRCAVACPDEVRRLVEAGAGRITLGFAPQAREQVAQDVAHLIDHTLLKAEATEPQVRQLCEEAKTHKFASVCVNPHWVPLCAELLRGSPVLVCTVIGFPLGATTTSTKVFETHEACRNGAQEVDMVLNIGALKGGQMEVVHEDIRAVADAAHQHGAQLKVIFETSLLTDEEKVQAAMISRMAGADYVKTSTGFSTGGATVADVALMRQVVDNALGVKASGGVRGLGDTLQMIEAGATRIGASAGLRIVEQAKSGTWDDSKSKSSSSSPY
ncbi:MAG: deoxyribose-phosphate aldolase [Ardenticatenales bacterium]|nr:deoxyribose-phosphate aldolase [Ardenticatenales bacterium]